MKNMYERQVNFQKSMNTNLNVMFLALVDELGEFVASLGYADWKKTQRDEENLIVEGMDICIFAMNCHYYSGGIFNEPRLAQLDIIDDVTLVAELINLISAREYLNILPLLFRRYPKIKQHLIGKQALNTFRQDKGYKVGKYKKIWNGAEDNVTMLNFVLNNPTATFETIYTFLQTEYNRV